jgi:hypothetical protein
MAETQFYQNVKPLNKNRHSDWCLEPLTGYSFARNLNSCFLMISEFVKASREYPIVFVKGENRTYAAAVLGFRNQENLYLQEDNEWEADYIPAYIRRYPFIPASSPNDELMVCIDENFIGFNRAGLGARLFEEDGSLSKVLENAVGFLKGFQGHAQLTENFCMELERLDLLEPMTARVDLNSGESFALSDFWVINREKLAGLDADSVHTLFKSGGLEYIFAHLFSIENFEKLMSRIKLD